MNPGALPPRLKLIREGERQAGKPRPEKHATPQWQVIHQGESPWRPRAVHGWLPPEWTLPERRPGSGV